MPHSQPPRNWKQIRNRSRVRKIVATNRPTTIYERKKLAAIQLLDRIGKYEDPAFMLVVSAREYDAKADAAIPITQVLVSDERMQSALIDEAQNDYVARFGGAGEAMGEE